MRIQADGGYVGVSLRSDDLVDAQYISDGQISVQVRVRSRPPLPARCKAHAPNDDRKNDLVQHPPSSNGYASRTPAAQESTIRNYALYLDLLLFDDEWDDPTNRTIPNAPDWEDWGDMLDGIFTSKPTHMTGWKMMLAARVKQQVTPPPPTPSPSSAARRVALPRLARATETTPRDPTPTRAHTHARAGVAQPSIPSRPPTRRRT